MKRILILFALVLFLPALALAAGPPAPSGNGIAGPYVLMELTAPACSDHGCTPAGTLCVLQRYDVESKQFVLTNCLASANNISTIAGTEVRVDPKDAKAVYMLPGHVIIDNSDEVR